MSININIKRTHQDAAHPRYATDGAMCFDLHACLNTYEIRILRPGDITAIPTGLVFELPAGWGLNVFARSGLASRGITLANGVGKIDPDYRGELHVLLANLSDEHITICHGDRIAQAEPVQVVRATFTEVERTSDTKRGAGGFGSTGVSLG